MSPDTAKCLVEGKITPPTTHWCRVKNQVYEVRMCGFIARLYLALLRVLSFFITWDHVAFDPQLNVPKY